MPVAAATGTTASNASALHRMEDAKVPAGDDWELGTGGPGRVSSSRPCSSPWLTHSGTPLQLPLVIAHDRTTARWHLLTHSPEELRFDTTLMGGQCFRWRETTHLGQPRELSMRGKPEDTDSTAHPAEMQAEGPYTQPFRQWSCALFGSQVITLRQTPHHTYYYAHPPVATELPYPTPEEVDTRLRDYLRLALPLAPLYAEWARRDVHFARVAPSFPGVRVLRQEPLETLLAFICSSNNHIPRISSMVQALCREYGTRVPAPVWSACPGKREEDALAGKVELEGVKVETGPGEQEKKAEDEQAEPEAGTGSQDFYTFPSLEALRPHALPGGGMEARLRQLGFGYRAKYVQNTVGRLLGQPSDYLHGLRELDLAACRTELMALDGVGAKVADCIALMALDQPSAIPVDTHVLSIATRCYGFRLQGSTPRSPVPKSLTPHNYARVGQLFADRFGERCGWAHTVLFMADLAMFSAGAGRSRRGIAAAR